MGKRRREDDNEQNPRPKKASNAEEDDDFEAPRSFSQKLPAIEQSIWSSEEDPNERWLRIAGVVEYVKLKNFMCHAEYKFSPKDRLNFLSGVNGR